MNYKSKRANATNIPKSVKEAVYKRDGGRCIVCGKQGIPNAHYIRRSHGGLGIEQNIVTLCTTCHNDFDNGQYREQIGAVVREYLQQRYYPNWHEEDLAYNKWKDFKIK